MMNFQAQHQPRYCDIVNSRYQQNASFYQNLKDRLNSTLLALPPSAQKYKRYMLSEAIKEFQRRYPSITKFKQLRLCKAEKVKLSQIIIDDTMQRKLDIDWVIKILSNFNEFQIMPIQVYKVIGTEILFASWDGQHTAMVLYIVSTMILNDTDEVEIPVCIYEVSGKAEIRNNFISNNTEEGKKLLDKIDVFQQQVYGVRIDGSTNEKWIEAERKQKCLENNGLFVTAEKFGDCDQPGAISRIDEIVRYPVSVIEELTAYLGISCQDQRPADPKEVYILSNWFAMGHNVRQKYTEADLFKLHALFKDKFNADFSPEGAFWKLVEKSYIDFKEKENAWIREQLGDMFVKEARINKDWTQGGTYLWHLVNTYYEGPIPELNINTPYTPENV
jgi:hypothetical protein